MGKITVKHYLNTDVKEEISPAYIFDGRNFQESIKDTLYPVYLQITVNRKTTKLRSPSNVRLFTHEFNEYASKSTYSGEKKYTDYNTNLFLYKEVELIKSALDYFYNEKKEDQEKIPIREVVNYYMQDIGDGPFCEKIYCATLGEINNSNYLFIDEIIRKDVNTVLIVDYLVNKFGIDIYSLIDNDSISLLNAFDLLFKSMIKDKKGKIIGKLIEWYSGSLRQTFESYLQKKSIKNIDLIIRDITNFMDEEEKTFILQKKNNRKTI